MDKELGAGGGLTHHEVYVGRQAALTCPWPISAPLCPASPELRCSMLPRVAGHTSGGAAPGEGPGHAPGEGAVVAVPAVAHNVQRGQRKQQLKRHVQVPVQASPGHSMGIGALLWQPQRSVA